MSTAQWGVLESDYKAFLDSLTPDQAAYAAAHPFAGPHYEEYTYWQAGVKDARNVSTWQRALSGATLTPEEQLAIDMPGYSGQSIVRGFASPYDGIAAPSSTDNPGAQQALFDRYKGIHVNQAASDWAAYNTAAAQASRDHSKGFGGLGAIGTLALAAAAIYTGGAAAGWWGAAEGAAAAGAGAVGMEGALGAGLTYGGASGAALGMEGALGAGLTYGGSTAAAAGMGGALGSGIAGGLSSATLAGYAATATGTAAEVAANAGSWFSDAKSAYNVASKAKSAKNAISSLTGGTNAAAKFTGALGMAGAASGAGAAAAGAGILAAPVVAAAMTKRGQVESDNAPNLSMPAIDKTTAAILVSAGLLIFVFGMAKNG